MKQGAIFDMDGTMFDTERLYQKTWNAEWVDHNDLPAHFPSVVHHRASAATPHSVADSQQKPSSLH